MGSYKWGYKVISKVAIIRTHIRGLVSPLVTTHEPPSTVQDESMVFLLKTPYVFDVSIQDTGRLGEASQHQDAMPGNTGSRACV